MSTLPVLFCFRRDLRLADNLGLHALHDKYPDAPVLPVFCLDPRQLSAANTYRSAYAVRFLFESLADLHAQLRARERTAHGLVVLRGRPEDVLPTLAKQCHAQAVGWNEDVTPFARQRDAALTKALALHVQQVVTHADDVTVVPVRTLRTKSTNSVFKVFTPFCRAARALGVRKPRGTPKCTYVTSHALAQVNVCKKALDASNLWVHAAFADVREQLATSHNTHATTVYGGRTHAKKRLQAAYLRKRCAQYATARDLPANENTTRLSAYLKFGCVSFREAHFCIEQALATRYPKACEALTRELFWNAFYAYITWHSRDVLRGQLHPNTNITTKHKRNAEYTENLRGTIDKVWRDPNHALTKQLLHKWQTGHTGFPFVDAAMRQLRTTGWMHNRPRMVVASFLTKDLRIDWREGERHFARHLVDYDPSANNGGWQWAASTGADAQPYFRVFNPWSQSKKFDKDARYIKRYVPELAEVAARHVHRWDDADVRARYEGKVGGYGAPVVDHAAARVEVLGLWKGV